jgi:hypothetical protein
MDIKGMIARAAELGREQCKIGLDHGLQHLSRDAWVAKAAALANMGVPELRALRRRIEETCPHAWREVLIGGRGWVESGQPEPAIMNTLGDGDRFPAAYAELKVAGVSLEAASAVCALVVAEIAPAARWGRLQDHEERNRLCAGIADELGALDRAIRHELRLTDCGWTAAGRPCLDLGPLGVLELGEHNVVAIAAETAQRAGRRLLETRAA